MDICRTEAARAGSPTMSPAPESANRPAETTGYTTRPALPREPELERLDVVIADDGGTRHTGVCGGGGVARPPPRLLRAQATAHKRTERRAAPACGEL